MQTNVIAESSANVSEIEQFELIQIFSRKLLFWHGGQRITVFIKPQNSVGHKIFTMSILNISPYKYKTLLDTVVYTGNNIPPIEIKSDEEMLIKLQNTPYSIGYVNFSIVINSNNQYLTVIKIK
jgi:ABC-type phosphate transport system substrate-binding protein